MKKIETIKDVTKVGAGANDIHYLKSDGSLYNAGNKKVVANDVFDFKLISTGFVYTPKEMGDLHVRLHDGTQKVLHGFYYLAFFRETSTGFVTVKNNSADDLENNVVILDRSLSVIKPFRFFKANMNGYFVTGTSRDLVVFDENLNEVWKRTLIEIENDSGDATLLRVFHETVDGIFIAPLSNGEILAIDIATGELKWKWQHPGRVSVFEDKVYCIADYTISEIDAVTGKPLREQSMQDLIDSSRFRPTGEHKVYDKYIFAIAAGKPGMVAIYDRRTLKYIETIETEQLITVGVDHLHYHNGKLFILDFGRTLHVYQDA